MTAISTVISKNCIAFGSDSLLTEFKNGEVRYKEYKRSKIVPIRGLKAAMAYWGLAQFGTFNTLRFLKDFATKCKSSTLEDFVVKLEVELKDKVANLSIDQKYKGIGIHISGFENRFGLLVPELFLISNFFLSA